jgi:hypothetical protein
MVGHWVRWSVMIMHTLSDHVAAIRLKFSLFLVKRLRGVNGTGTRPCGSSVGTLTAPWGSSRPSFSVWAIKKANSQCHYNQIPIFLWMTTEFVLYLRYLKKNRFTWYGFHFIKT